MPPKRQAESSGPAAKKAKVEETHSEDPYKYNVGFGNHFASEALEGALPEVGNNPQRCPYGLYCEQLTGTAFTLTRALNQRSWLYRIRPGVCHDEFQPMEKGLLKTNFNETQDTMPYPNQLRWMPLPIPDAPTDFISGLVTMAGSGSPELKNGMAIHMYAFNQSMENSAFYNSDGDFLFVQQEGVIDLQTEFGWMRLTCGEIAVIQRGIRFAVHVVKGPVRGYICEVFKSHFRIPDLGPIGSNGLANPRDFVSPVAAYEDKDEPFKLINKYQGEMFVANSDHSPFDVVAWHGNYTPYKYDLRKFCCINSVTYDHPDPSIYTVLTCPTDEPGTATCDFVIFPARWMVMENTFRPPWYHRNCMSEFMGNITGVYDAKEDGFLPGGASLHSCMTAHGPEAAVFEKASTMPLGPVKLAEDSLAFMFETSHLLRLTKNAWEAPHRDRKYMECWRDLKKHFNPNQK